MLTHDVFYNRERSGYEELFSYMPGYWRQILEMRANNKFAGYTLEKMADALERIVLDQFIDTCSEEMLNRFETFLGLTGYANRSIQEQRNLVKASWVSQGKMSRTRIKSLVRAYCDCDAEVHFTHAVSIIAKVVEGTSNIYLGDLQYILSKQIPAHLSWYTVLDAESNPVKVGRSICYWVYDYEKSGVNPDVSTLGEAIQTDFQIETEFEGNLYDYMQTGTSNSGLRPDVSVIGAALESSINTKPAVDIYTYKYDKPGEKECGTTPDISTVGLALDASVSAEGTTDSYKYESTKAGSKSCGEEDL